MATTSTKKLFTSKRVFLDDRIIQACVIVENGKISFIQPGDASKIPRTEFLEVRSMIYYYIVFVYYIHSTFEGV